MARLAVGTRFEVFKRDRFTCQYCGKKGGELEVDHVKPLCQGGTDELSNLKTACFECNRGKSGAKLGQLTEPRTTAKYAIHTLEGGGVDWVGEIVRSTDDSIEIEAIDAVMAMAGLWATSEEVFKVPRSECRFFTTKQAALTICHQINGRIYARRKQI